MLVFAAWNERPATPRSRRPRSGTRSASQCGSNCVDDAQHRRLDVAGRRARVVPPLHRHRHQRHDRDPDEDHEHDRRVPTMTSRRRLAASPTCTSPARPDAASMPVSATVATTSPKIRSSHCGAEPRWIESVSAPGSQNSDRPTADDREQHDQVEQRQAPGPARSRSTRQAADVQRPRRTRSPAPRSRTSQPRPSEPAPERPPGSARSRTPRSRSRSGSRAGSPSRR